MEDHSKTTDTSQIKGRPPASLFVAHEVQLGLDLYEEGKPRKEPDPPTAEQVAALDGYEQGHLVTLAWWDYSATFVDDGEGFKLSEV